ncbi:esterase-like activity of phytase family protein [Blastomonas aquatica]|uniref:Phytase-like domain-containing protein n=1 Tax=Blastomonas aquatica TaxID=1510276 RepID=A0ABQ1JHU5_9SPHN|nr:esterase-like activity of phytase family protein [Blastomonas aquatica]GGB67153.1 hypothetical protein GCM10010833_22960 [Blastomonas aquatica]
MIRRALALLSLMFFLGTGAFVADSPLPPNTSQQIVLKRPLDLPALPHRLGNGELTLIDGWELDSDNSDFGGFSALHTTGNGRLLALSDASILAGFTIGEGSTAQDSFIAPLPIRRGERSTKKDQDAESLTHDPVSGRYWVGFEHNHRIRRYSPGFARAEATGAPPAMANWPKNGGAEAILRRPDGSFIVFAEAHSEAAGVTTGLIFDGDPAEPAAPSQRFSYRPPPGYRMTDVAALPDGRLLALHRKFHYLSGVSAKLGIIDPAQIVPGGLVEPRVIATLKPPFPVDNMEGIAIDREQSQTIIWIISDDNFMTLQRTLLLKFEFSGPRVLPRS